jgi:predicted AAA+ superfamily ATPase
VKTHPLKANPLFGELPLELARNIESVNPWWTDGEPLDPPRYRRWPFDRMLRLLKSGMTPAIVLRGPRRVGKTVILRQAIQALLGEGVSPGRILYAPFDELPTFRGIKEPVLAVARWFEQTKLKASFNQMANEGHPAYLFLDEVQNLDAWAPQIKNLMDNHGVRALVTGSSSLRIEAGRDSLAGRVTTLEMGPLLLREIAGLRFGVACESYLGDNRMERLTAKDFWTEAVVRGAQDEEIRSQSFKAFSARGGYPIAQERHDTPWHELAAYLNETVIRRAIQHDLRMGPRG